MLARCCSGWCGLGAVSECLGVDVAMGPLDEAEPENTDRRSEIEMEVLLVVERCDGSFDAMLALVKVEGKAEGGELRLRASRLLIWPSPDGALMWEERTSKKTLCLLFGGGGVSCRRGMG